MSSINDWASKAAEKISEGCGRDCSNSDTRIAAIIELYAKPWLDLLRRSRRGHDHCDDSWYCCGACTHECIIDETDHEHDNSCYVSSHGAPVARVSGICNCGADAWNTKINKALDGTR